MAKLKKGILGPMSGKLGPIIGASWKGIPYLRSTPKIKNNVNRSPAQILNQQKFKFLNHFLVPFHPYLNIGFRHAAKGKTEINAGFTANFKQVFGEYPELSINYSQFTISEGNLAVLNSPVLSWLNHQQLKLTWSFPIERKSNFDDQLMLVLYSPELHRADGIIGGIKRAALQCTYTPDERFLDVDLHVYAAMVALNGKSVSNSIYLGRMVMP